MEEYAIMRACPHGICMMVRRKFMRTAVCFVSWLPGGSFMAWISPNTTRGKLCPAVIQRNLSHYARVSVDRAIANRKKSNLYVVRSEHERYVVLFFALSGRCSFDEISF